MPLDIFLAYFVACLIITIVPGPTVTVIVANSLAHGTRAGLLNVAGTQVVILSLTAMLAALLTDGAYAILSGRAGSMISRSRVRLVSRISGGFLIGSGIWLALTRAR